MKSTPSSGKRAILAAVLQTADGEAAKADTIAHRMKMTAREKMEQVPAFYKKFSRMIDDAIEAYKQGRLTESDYLQKMEEMMQTMRAGRDESTPLLTSCLI